MLHSVFVVGRSNSIIVALSRAKNLTTITQQQQQQRIFPIKSTSHQQNGKSITTTFTAGSTVATTIPVSSSIRTASVAVISSRRSKINNQISSITTTAPYTVRKMTIPTEPSTPFHCVHVHIQVVPGMEAAFIEATLENARSSSNEEGVVRFDVYRDQENTNEFVLVEVYKDSTMAPAQHKETSHYLLWRDTVAPMMATERTRKLYNNIFPVTADGWNYPSHTPLE